MTFNYRKGPCRTCPWRRDVEPGAFGIDRYEQLAVSCGSPQFGDPMFACHQTIEGQEVACAGWLAVHGLDHPNVRMAGMAGLVAEEALEPQPGWPPLFSSFEEMVEVQAGPRGVCSIRPPAATSERG